MRLTLLEVHAGALNVRLDESRVKLERLVQVGKGRLAVAPKVAEGTAHVVCQRLVLLKTASLNSLLERLSRLVVALASAELDRLKTLAQVRLAAAFGEVGGLLETFGKAIVAEGLQVV